MGTSKIFLPIYLPCVKTENILRIYIHMVDLNDNVYYFVLGLFRKGDIATNRIRRPKNTSRKIESGTVHVY